MSPTQLLPQTSAPALSCPDGHPVQAEGGPCPCHGMYHHGDHLCRGALDHFYDRFGDD